MKVLPSVSCMKLVLRSSEKEILMRIPSSFPLAKEERASHDYDGKQFPFRAPDYFFKKINPLDPEDPVRRQIIPRADELRIKDIEKPNPWPGRGLPSPPRL